MANHESTTTTDMRALAERLRRHSDQIQSIAWTGLKNDLIDAARLVERLTDLQKPEGR